MDSIHSRRFGGVARLYSDAALNRFMQSHVCVIGLGGVGSWAVEALARTGVGTLTLIDLDNVAESNVNRQLPAITSQFGMPKVTALANRVKEINPNSVVHCIEDFVTEENIPIIFAKPFDFVIDAIDQVRVKAAMAAYFLQQRQPFIVSGGAGGRRNAMAIEVASLQEVTHDKLLANLRYTLKKRHHIGQNPKDFTKVNCVFSRESVVKPNNQYCETNASLQGLSCAGYGASMMVTASFGLCCAQTAIDYLSKSSKN
ncbi:tRNA threonylcarbamoyladenosine dehydratase [Neisseria sp. Ec49-e6-T10]|uniref:tRNA threonylcarbamoyladenosine dehydratase n=1 Tax=Neisseria sp. Ec49-e6-T10 TaxID=3140744 RepID=UPI003EB7FD8A